jgi:molecular chaperone GrpE
VEEARIEARGRVLKEMLPVVDNLERAVQHVEQTVGDDKEAAGILDGVRLVLRQFAQAFERCDVKLIEAEGAAFDPNLHEAISQVSTGEVPPGTVVSVLQRGYLIGNRLLRPALVVVAQAPPAATEASGAGNGASAAGDGAAAEAKGDGDTGDDGSGGDKPAAGGGSEQEQGG